MKFFSIRWRLALSYAGIALFAALALGLMLLVSVRGYYLAREREYLHMNAEVIAHSLAPLLEYGLTKTDLETQLHSFSFLSQSRIRLYDDSGSLVADSGKRRDNLVVFSGLPVSKGQFEVPYSSLVVGAWPPVPNNGTVPGGFMVLAVDSPGTPGSSTSSTTITRAVGIGCKPGEDPAECPPAQMAVSSLPVSGSMFGFSLNAEPDLDAQPSDQVLRQPVLGSGGQQMGTLELSEGPAYGREIVDGVGRGWLIASAGAVLLAALAGWWISRQISAPVLALTAATRRMAAGDLAARAEVKGRDEIGELARSFNEMVERVETTVETLRRFASDAAHELNTPLTALRTNVELAIQAGDEEARGYLDRALAQGSRLESLTSDLLDLSRLESQANDKPFEAVDLSEVLRDQAEGFASQAEQAGINFEIDLPQGPVQVMGEREKLSRALRNLLENAVKFTPPEGCVKAGVTPIDGEVCLWVEDSGIGIPEEDRPHLFQRFHRGRNASGYPGSGLGLAILRAITERHQGRVDVEHLEPGTRFTLVLPGRT